MGVLAWVWRRNPGVSSVGSLAVAVFAAVECPN